MEQDQKERVEKLKALVIRREEEKESIVAMAQKLYSMRYGGTNGFESHRIGTLLDEYTKLLIPDLLKAFDAIWEGQKQKRESYGDIDWSIEKFEGKCIGREGEDDPQTVIRALVMDNHCSCANNTRFLVIHQTDGWFPKIHVRTVFKKGDDKGGWDGHKPLSWYKKRGFSLDYVEKLHTTDLGGSYGDCRDNGYIATFDRFLWDEWKVDRISPAGFQTLTNMILPYLEQTVVEINEYAEITAKIGETTQDSNPNG